jgi:hypothetical protein
MLNDFYPSVAELARKIEALTLKLESSDATITSLKLELSELSNRNIELTVALENVLTENARLCMVTNHRVESLKIIKSEKQSERKGYFSPDNTLS